MLCPRVVKEGTGRGKGESITAKAMTSRHTNVTETNKCPVFFVYRRKEVCIYPHAEKHVCTPTDNCICVQMYTLYMCTNVYIVHTHSYVHMTQWVCGENNSSMNIISVTEAVAKHDKKNPRLHACAPRTDMY